MLDTKQLITMLQSDNPNKRHEACELLRVAPQPLPQEAINALRNATNDKSAKISEAAQRAFAVHTSIKGGEAIPNIQAEVLIALENMRVEKTTSQSRRKMLGLSLLAFVIAGWLLTALSNSFTIINLFIVVIMIFIHETGHYIAMRQFGYRNLKMFFIPFFGAAVSGHACVPVTKEAIVYLLGPIPGIIIGCAFIIVHLFTHETLWLDTARIFITINTINLLPLYPLDGGRLVFGILPQKTYQIQWLFQIVFIILTLSVSWNLNARLVGSLLGFILVRSWRFHQYNKIASTLLESGITKTRARSNIPPKIASEIISLVQRETGFTEPKEIAKSTWAVWARVKAKRPTPREQVYLIAAYLSALALGISVWLKYFSI